MMGGSTNDAGRCEILVPEAQTKGSPTRSSTVLPFLFCLYKKKRSELRIWCSSLVPTDRCKSRFGRSLARRESCPAFELTNFKSRELRRVEVAQRLQRDTDSSKRCRRIAGGGGVTQNYAEGPAFLFCCRLYEISVAGNMVGRVPGAVSPIWCLSQDPKPQARLARLAHECLVFHRAPETLVLSFTLARALLP